MKSQNRPWNKGVLALSFLLAALSGLVLVAAYSWKTRVDTAGFAESRRASQAAASVSSPEHDSPHEPSTRLLPRPAIRLIATAVADDRTRSTATIHVDATQRTFVVHPGQVVATDADPDEALIADGGVARTADTILESVGPGWARFQRADEQWIEELTDVVPLTRANIDSLVAVLGDPSLSPGEVGQRLLEAKRGIPIRENFLSEASFAPRFDERGEMNGVHIRSVVPDGVFARMGLASGDVLLAVNGVELDTPEATEKALTAFEGSSPLRMTRERHGQVESISALRAQ